MAGRNEKARQQQLSSAPARVLHKAVVVEVFNDLSIYTLEHRAHYMGMMANPEHFHGCPRNSALVSIISGGANRRATSPAYICYPFFPPHMCLPLKAGEVVWVVSETEQLSSESSGDPEANLLYWMCRVSGPVHIDDLNFTHLDRRHVHDGRYSHDPDSSENETDAGLVVNNDESPGFPNGAGIPDRYSLSPDMFPRGYADIFETSLSSQSFTFEAVPRFTKRPGDLVIQGSNNTLICLGEERGWNAETAATLGFWENSDASTADPDSEMWVEEPDLDLNERSYAGAIDIVAGRGRYQQPSPDDDPELTACRKIENTLGFEEVDKNPVQFMTTEPDEDDRFGNISDRPTEGDTDFISDASRVYVSMNSRPDIYLGLEYPQVPPVGDSNDGEDVPVIEAEGEGAPTVFIKSDEIRIVARQTEAETPAANTPEIKGSIKIIKEGVLDSEEGDGQASIILQPDGVIMIDGPKIVLGSGIEKDNGAGTQLSIGLGATEPLVLGDELKLRLEEIIDVIKKVCDKLAAHTHPTGTGPSGPPLPPELPDFAGGIDSGDLQPIRDKLDLIKSKVGKLL